MAENLTQSAAREIFAYDPDSGYLHWRISPKWGIRAGDKVGYMHKSGYVATKFKRDQYLVHRIVWLIEFGYFPTVDIDHINRDRSDNRIINLRLATRAQNAQNCVTRRIGNSGVPGVSWHKQSKKWRASIKANGEHIHLGGFDCLDDAALARKLGEIAHHKYRPEAI